MQRICQLVNVRPEEVAEYEQIHKEVWPGVLQTITACNITNYSIFRHNDLLIAYFEYTGDDLAADMAKMAADPTTQEWWKITSPMQTPLPEAAARGELWLNVPSVFYHP
jgi:L-rhamnose mutarotase